MVEWSRTYETPESDRISRVLSAEDGGYILDGYSAEWQDATSYGYFIKTDSTGNSGCNTTSVSTTSGTVNVTVGSGFNFISKGCAVTTPSVNSSAGLSFSTICTSVGIKELDNLIPGVSVESNPFSNTLKVNINDVKGNISLYDIAGKLIMQQNAVSMNTTLNTEKLTPGMYILRTATSSGFSSMKVVKQ